MLGSVSAFGYVFILASALGIVCGFASVPGPVPAPAGCQYHRLQGGQRINKWNLAFAYVSVLGSAPRSVLRLHMFFFVFGCAPAVCKYHGLIRGQWKVPLQGVGRARCRSWGLVARGAAPGD